MLATPLSVAHGSEPCLFNPSTPQQAPLRQVREGALCYPVINPNSPVFSFALSLCRFLSATVICCVTHTYGAPPTHARPPAGALTLVNTYPQMWITPTEPM